jgi:hypothetical protein
VLQLLPAQRKSLLKCYNRVLFFENSRFFNVFDENAKRFEVDTALFGYFYIFVRVLNADGCQSYKRVMCNLKNNYDEIDIFHYNYTSFYNLKCSGENFIEKQYRRKD